MTVTRVDTTPTRQSDQDAQALIREARRRQRRRRWLFLGLVTLLLVVALAVLPGITGKPPGAAAVALDQLASRAGLQDMKLRRGQYYYTEVQTPLETGQTWVGADGSGRLVDTTHPFPYFYSARDQHFGPRGAAQVQGPIRVHDLRSLPVSTSIGTESMAMRNIGVVTNCSELACTVFARASALLQGPDVGVTAPLRSALFGLLAQVHGVKLLGRVVDRAGRRGMGFEVVEGIPGGTGSFTCEKADGTITAKGSYHFPPSSVTYVMVVDPRTTNVLSTSERFWTGAAPVGPSCSGFPTGQVAAIPPNWTLLVRSGIVDSETSVPR